MWHAWERNVYRVLKGKPEGKRPLGRPGRRKYNVETDLHYGVSVWTGFIWDQRRGSCQYTDDTSGSLKGGVLLE
jgi:hypothetical protein